MDGPAEATLVADVGARLIGAVTRVTMEEYRHQEAHFDEDSQRGRELLYLSANDEWVRGTDEVVELAASNSIETTIRVHVDLMKITHEAIRDRSGSVWLPLVVLAPPVAGDQPTLRPFPRVLDASGAVQASLPQSEARRWMAAALSEIILQMTPLVIVEKPASREHRLLLSAALYRTLRDDSGQVPTGTGTPPTLPIDQGGERGGRIRAARLELVAQLEKFLARLKAGQADPGHRRAVLLITRAARIVHALSSPTTIVVVPVEVGSVPTEFSIQLPSRPLESNQASWVLSPRAHLDVGLTFASGETDRSFSLVLPTGVSLGPVDSEGVRAQIRMNRPQSWRRLSDLVTQIVDRAPGTAGDPTVVCLGDLALEQLDIVLETGRHYDPDPVAAQSGRRADSPTTWGVDLRAGLRALLDGTAPDDAAVPRDLATGLAEGDHLYRVLQAGAVNPRTAHVWVPAVENRSARTSPSPSSASVQVQVVATRSAAAYTASYAGTMSLAVLALVLLLLLIFDNAFDDQVLGGVLTLFAAIQASRIEQPDRSTLRGLLISAGSWLVAASVLPTVLLGVALAFSKTHEGWVPLWAWIAVGFQTALVLMMTVGPLTDTWAVGAPRLQLTGGLDVDYERVDVLHTSWWRTTTAGALMLGRPAFGYLIRQDRHDLEAMLGPSLAGPGSDGPANILAMLRVGTGERSLTFLVFRDQPPTSWQTGNAAVPVVLDTDRLVAYESDIGHADFYLGLVGGVDLATHPLLQILGAARRDLRTVLDVQLPAAPPPGADPDRFWARVRIGLRARELADLGDFLADVAAAIGAAREPGVQMLVDVTTRTPPRWFIGRPSAGSVRPSPPSLDVVSPAVREFPGRDWLILGVCADGRSGAELDVLEQLQEQRPGLTVAGLSTALMHGVAVVFVVAHGEPESLDELAGRRPVFRDAQVLVADVISAAEAVSTATPPPGLLLQMQVVAVDRPGLIDLLLHRLEEEVATVMGMDRALITPAVLYALTEVADGRLAVTRVMVRLGLDAAHAPQLQAALPQVERALRRSILTPAAAAQPVGGPGWWDARAVVSLHLVPGAAQ